MACQKNCDKEKSHNPQNNYVFIVLILYILLAIIIGGNLFY